MTLVVHPHLHPRRTGVTRHVESVMPLLSEAFEVACVGGDVLDSALPRMDWRAVRRRARREPVIVHAHRNNEMLAGLWLKRTGAKVHLVFTRHAAGRPSAPTRWLLRRADRVLSLTAEMARALPVPSTIVPHGVDTRRFTPPADRAAAYAALGFPGTAGIGVVGRVRPEKGQGDLVEALAPLLPAHDAWTVVVTGASRGHAAFAASLEARLGGRLHLAGERADVEAIYRGLSLVVQPSRSEGFGLTVLEAMASGCCVVSASTGAASDVIADGETGFLYPPGDVAALRRILEGLLAEPERMAEVGRRARAVVCARHSLQTEAAALAALYGELVASGRVRAETAAV
jgi:mannosyltransferase